MLGFEGFGGLKDYGGLGVWGFKDIGPGRMPQPARSSGRHQPGRAQDTDYEDLSREALGFLEYGLLGCPSHLVLLVGTTILKGLREVFRIRGVRALGFVKVWPARMPQPQSCRSSAWNHQPERAQGGHKD